MYQATLKVAGGKLLRVTMEMQNMDGDLLIQNIQLTGDFFLHPEDVLPEIEKALNGMGWPTDEDEYIGVIQDVLNKYHATFIGVSPQDIAQAILMAKETA